MKTNLHAGLRLMIVFVCFVIAAAGFMIRLPSAFRHFDKELHAAFYFGAAAFLNLLFAGSKTGRHVIIFIALFLFSVAIEAAQEYSNKLVGRRIHGRFDPEDLQWNLTGLVAFSVLWFIWLAVFRKSRVVPPRNNVRD